MADSSHQLAGGKNGPGLEELCPEGLQSRSEAVAEPSQPAGDQTEDVAAGPEAILPLTAQLHTPPTKPSIFVCSTNRLSDIFLRL